jgi:hypothetical protein
LAKKFIKKREEAKRKMDSLKQGEIRQEGAFYPITKRLKTISDQLQNTDLNFYNNINKKYDHYKKNQNLMKQEILPISSLLDETSPQIMENTTLRKKNAILKEKEIMMSDFEENNPANASHYEEETLISEPSKRVDYTLDDLMNESLEENRSTQGKMLDTHAYEQYLQTFDEVPRQYIDAMIRDRKRQFDHRTGITHDAIQERFFVGASEVKFVGSDITVNDTFYKTTPGLYQLLFKNNPKNYTQEDLYTYKTILDSSNARRQNFHPGGQIQGTRSYKYKSIIAPLYFEQKATYETPKTTKKKTLGKGMFKELTNNPIDYVYWDDPNELVNRLRLLIASQSAGHTGHSNEIVSVIEELREANIIE